MTKEELFMRKTRLLLTVLSLSAALSSTALAGTWQSDSTGWWYQNDDGTYPANTWQWIDGNGDGISENYYFDADGYCLTGTTTPDSSTVNADGALTINGIVQTQDTPAKTSVPQPAQTEAESLPVTATVWIPATGKKYHSIPNCGRMNPDKATQLSLSDALARGYTRCSKCY